MEIIRYGFLLSVFLLYSCKKDLGNIDVNPIECIFTALVPKSNNVGDGRTILDADAQKTQKVAKLSRGACTNSRRDLRADATFRSAFTRRSPGRSASVLCKNKICPCLSSPGDSRFFNNVGDGRTILDADAQKTQKVAKLSRGACTNSRRDLRADATFRSAFTRRSPGRSASVLCKNKICPCLSSPGDSRFFFVTPVSSGVGASVPPGETMVLGPPNATVAGGLFTKMVLIKNDGPPVELPRDLITFDGKNYHRFIIDISQHPDLGPNDNARVRFHFTLPDGVTGSAEFKITYQEGGQHDGMEIDRLIPIP